MSPVLLGFENLPAPHSDMGQRPMLFVGNHQRMGFYDTPLLVYELAVRGYRYDTHTHTHAQVTLPPFAYLAPYYFFISFTSAYTSDHGRASTVCVSIGLTEQTDRGRARVCVCVCVCAGCVVWLTPGTGRVLWGHSLTGSGQ